MHNLSVQTSEVPILLTPFRQYPRQVGSKTTNTNHSRNAIKATMTREWQKPNPSNFLRDGASNDFNVNDGIFVNIFYHLDFKSNN
mmetsp:Transcript_12184/g.21122  ORF Transcript_12184/g.21122 Transcript_12184/m.21122 type:complete len:85 (-) Transcript_12184:60-314(-)